MRLGETYAQLPPCIDDRGHRFTIPAQSSRAVCERCGHIRERPEPSLRDRVRSL